MSEREQVRALIIQRGIDSLEIALSDKTARAFGDLGIPSTVVLDAHGQLRIVHVGDIDDIGAILEKDLAAIDDR